ncbi:MAG: thioesterase [Acidimicrobiia bacterium]|nr:thioesterase [Acidimicrobiia bacterium]
MTDRWLPATLLRTAAHTRVFCLPHAGAGASTFRTWASELPAELQLCAVQLPGRENRLGEPPIDDARTLARDLAAALQPFLDRAFVVFGHSMGALLAFELACELRRRNLPQPARLFLAAHRAPHLPFDQTAVHQLDPRAFRAELRRLEGTPDAVLANEELMQIAEPILRADFKLCETYVYEPVAPLDIPLSVFGGERDAKVPAAVLEPWRDHTCSSMSLRVLPGGHLFLQTARAELVTAMLADLHIDSFRLTI